MELKKELILRAISAFAENNIADFTYANLKDVTNKEDIRKILRALEEDKIITKINLNGMAFRYELTKTLDCPEFIFNSDLPFRYKCLLLELYNKEIKDYYSLEDLMRLWECTNFTARSRKTKILNYIEDINLKDSKLINKKIESAYRIINTSKGIQFGTNDREFKCNICGNTNPEDFYSSKSTCKKCSNQISRERYENLNIVDYLYTKSKHNKSVNKKFKHNLTKEDIKEILEKQDYKCYYTGAKLIEDRNGLDKKFTPSLDRIDSNIGYTKNNVVVCMTYVNLAKNDQSLNDFITLCKQVASRF